MDIIQYGTMTIMPNSPLAQIDNILTMIGVEISLQRYTFNQLLSREEFEAQLEGEGYDLTTMSKQDINERYQAEMEYRDSMCQHSEDNIEQLKQTLEKEMQKISPENLNKFLQERRNFFDAKANSGEDYNHDNLCQSKATIEGLRVAKHVNNIKK